MSSVNSSDISTLLEKWSEDKASLVEIEKRIEKYKRLANRIMNNQDTDKLSNTYYTLKRRELSRTTLTKQDVPNEIWKKYSRSVSYSAYYLTENK